MVLMKDIMWAFANAVSQVCVEDDGVSALLVLEEFAALAKAGSVMRACPREARKLRAGQRHGRLCARMGNGRSDPGSPSLRQLLGRRVPSASDLPPGSISAAVIQASAFGSLPIGSRGQPTAPAARGARRASHSGTGARAPATAQRAEQRHAGYALGESSSSSRYLTAYQQGSEQDAIWRCRSPGYGRGCRSRRGIRCCGCPARTHQLHATATCAEPDGYA